MRRRLRLGRLVRRVGGRPLVAGPVLVVPGPRAIRLRVRRVVASLWLWEVWEGCRYHGSGFAASWGEALAVGVAALEQAHAAPDERPHPVDPGGGAR